MRPPKLTRLEREIDEAARSACLQCSLPSCAEGAPECKLTRAFPEYYAARPKGIASSRRRYNAYQREYARRRAEARREVEATLGATLGSRAALLIKLLQAKGERRGCQLRRDEVGVVIEALTLPRVETHD